MFYKNIEAEIWDFFLEYFKTNPGGGNFEKLKKGTEIQHNYVFNSIV